MESDENKQNQSVEDEANSTLGWYDNTLNAAMWFSYGAVLPRNAACLLCGIMPDDDKVDPLSLSTDETTPNDFKNLLSTFEDVERCAPSSRTLEQWRHIASSRHLKFHTWIDEYLQAKKISNSAMVVDHAEVKAAPTTQDDHANGETKLYEINFDSTYIPSNAIGKLAIKAATELEHGSRKGAFQKQVMELLQKWADDGSEPDVLSMSDKKNRAVIWKTDKQRPKPFTLDACGKTLKKWNLGRR